MPLATCTVCRARVELIHERNARVLHCAQKRALRKHINYVLFECVCARVCVTNGNWPSVSKRRSTRRCALAIARAKTNRGAYTAPIERVHRRQLARSRLSPGHESCSTLVVVAAAAAAVAVVLAMLPYWPAKSTRGGRVRFRRSSVHVRACACSHGVACKCCSLAGFTCEKRANKHTARRCRRARPKANKRHSDRWTNDTRFLCVCVRGRCRCRHRAAAAAAATTMTLCSSCSRESRGLYWCPPAPISISIRRRRRRVCMKQTGSGRCASRTAKIY